MTVSDDNFFDADDEVIAAAPSYPVVFGVTLTPTVSGILLGVAGLLGALYILLNMVLPAWETYQQQQAKRDELKGTLAQKQATIKDIGRVKQELEQAKQQNRQVLTLFANEKTLNTLLLDLNNQVTSVRGTLKKYTPADKPVEVITDSSLGAGVNGKLKRSVVNVELEGTYPQTENILRRIEQLQPLLLVKDYKSTLAPETATTGPQGQVITRVGPPRVNTSFQLQALIPANTEAASEAGATTVPPRPRQQLQNQQPPTAKPQTPQTPAGQSPTAQPQTPQSPAGQSPTAQPQTQQSPTQQSPTAKPQTQQPQKQQ
jgi:type IV pilus assembly protein PilO